jgi:outer membrane lipoprotein-sorting protein
MVSALAFLVVSAHQSGQAILKKMAAAYDAVTTLDQNATGTMGKYTGTAHIRFKRPGLLRVTGNSMFGQPYQLLIDHSGTQVLNMGQWASQPSAEMGIAAITGVSGNAGMGVPSLLFHTTWGWGHIADTVGSSKVSQVTLGGRSAYKVEMGGQLPLTIWIDAKTHFAMKSQMSAMGNTIMVTFDTPIVNRPIPASAFTK